MKSASSKAPITAQNRRISSKGVPASKRQNDTLAAITPTTPRDDTPLSKTPIEIAAMNGVSQQLSAAKSGEVVPILYKPSAKALASTKSEAPWGAKRMYSQQAKPSTTSDPSFQQGLWPMGKTSGTNFVSKSTHCSRQAGQEKAVDRSRTSPSTPSEAARSRLE